MLPPSPQPRGSPKPEFLWGKVVEAQPHKAEVVGVASVVGLGPIRCARRRGVGGQEGWGGGWDCGVGSWGGIWDHESGIWGMGYGGWDMRDGIVGMGSLGWDHGAWDHWGGIAGVGSWGGIWGMG